MRVNGTYRRLAVFTTTVLVVFVGIVVDVHHGFAVSGDVIAWLVRHL